jgi:hypothetical protein
MLVKIRGSDPARDQPRQLATLLCSVLRKYSREMVLRKETAPVSQAKSRAEPRAPPPEYRPMRTEAARPKTSTLATHRSRPKTSLPLKQDRRLSIAQERPLLLQLYEGAL